MIRLVGLMYFVAGTTCIIEANRLKESDLYHAITDPEQLGFKVLFCLGILLFALAFINVSMLNQEM